VGKVVEAEVRKGGMGKAAEKVNQGYDIDGEKYTV
jgi:hypothetical protein